MHGLIDLLILSDQQANWVTRLALMEIALFAGVLLAAFSLLFLSMSRGVARLLKISPAWPTTLLVALISIPLAIELFSGAGVRQTFLGTVGPWITPVLCGSLAGISVFMLKKAAHPTPILRRLGFISTSLLALVVIYVERAYFPGLYTYLHVTAAWIGLGLLSICFFVLLFRPLPRIVVILSVACCLLAAVPTAAFFPATNEQRLAMIDLTRPLFAERVVSSLRWLIDFDRDGVSPLFGGGDCDDLDPSIGPWPKPCQLLGSDPLPPLPSATYLIDKQVESELARQATGRPTVILLIDALRLDRLQDKRFPQLAKLAKESIQFTSAYAPSSGTALSLPAIVTGHPRPNRKTPNSIEILQRSGVRTGIVTVNTVLEDTRLMHLRYDFTRGFDKRAVRKSTYLRYAWGGGLKQWTGDWITRQAMTMLDQPDRPQVLWVHYFDLHQWMVLEGLSSNSFARYDEILAKIDRQLERWRSRLPQINLVLTADHGEGLGHRGVTTHRYSLSYEVIRVPLLLRIPGVPGRRVSVPVSITSLAPTLLRLHNISPPRTYSANLLALANAPPEPHPPLLFLGDRQWSLVADRWRLVVDLGARAFWLYDLRKDPGERRNLADLHPTKLRRMLAGLFALHRRLP